MRDAVEDLKRKSGIVASIPGVRVIHKTPRLLNFRRFYFGDTNNVGNKYNEIGNRETS